MSVHWVTPAERALNDLIDLAVLMYMVAPEANKKIGPGRFLEKKATPEQREALAGLRSEELPQPRLSLFIY